MQVASFSKMSIKSRDSSLSSAHKNIRNKPLSYRCSICVHYLQFHHWSFVLFLPIVILQQSPICQESMEHLRSVDAGTVLSLLFIRLRITRVTLVLGRVMICWRVAVTLCQQIMWYSVRNIKLIVLDKWHI